uniref:Pre-mRNA splicing Prp18-interacting factor n=1 Tax=Tanacetum cinerariifolium TaxID=118510 RepID=A0A6L2K6W3_TANCI|nr:hypothetical protein [Tanacetum cinerariifolium]
MSLFNRCECLSCGQPCDGYHCYSCTCLRCGINLLDGICINCIYGDGKPVTCDVCEGMLRGEFCLSCDLKAENSFICDQNAYSFNNTSNNFNHLPQPQYENYLCNLCGNNSHDGYDCQQQFSLVYEQEPSYNQNYNDLQIINKELIECNHPTFFDDNEDHSVQYKEYLENSSKEIAASNSNQEKEKPPQDFDIRQLVREECCIEVCEEQKQNMENTMLELVQVCQQKELYCMHDNVDDLVESALNSKLLSINLNSQLHAITPILSNEEPEYSLSMGYEHPNTTSKTKSDKIIKSGVEELVQIPSECEVTSEDKRECDVPVCENSPIFYDNSEIFFDSNNDDISSDDDAFKDIKYVEASLPEFVSLEEENDVYHEEEEFNLKEIQDVVLREKLLSINRLIDNIKSLNNNPTPDSVLKSSASFPIFEEFDNFLSDNSSPEFEILAIKRKRREVVALLLMTLFSSMIRFALILSLIRRAMTRKGTSVFLKNYLSMILFFSNSESFDFEDDPLFPRPLPEPPDADAKFEPDTGEEISIVMDNIKELNKDNCFDPGGEFDISANAKDDDYFPFMFVIRIFLPYLIYPKVFPLLLSAESEDTIFDPGISV